MRRSFILLSAILLTTTGVSVFAADAKPTVSADEAAKKAAASAGDAADAVKKAADAVKKAEGLVKDSKTTDERMAAVEKLGGAAGKAKEAEDKAKVADEKAKAAEAAAKAGKLDDAITAALDAKTAAAEAAAAAKAAVEAVDPPAPTLNAGDTAWMLISSALVMLMVPGLALFYAGMVRSKNVLGTMMHSMAALAIIGVEWVVIGYAMSFGGTIMPGFMGFGEKAGVLGYEAKFLWLNGVAPAEVVGTIPIFVHMMFQGKFAIITPALISGAIAERVKFSTYLIFILLWGLLVYNPLAHWVWGAGFLGVEGVKALDFAGGTVVHLSAGVSALACILLLGKRRGYPEMPANPNSLVLTLTGAGLLWFGWFGFNGGSALGAIDQAGQAFATTQTAAAAAGLVWMLMEWFHRGKATTLGLASGLVAGLVGITPAAGYVTLAGALFIGASVAAVCYLFVTLKPVFGYDDSLDVVGVHGVGGIWGALMTGVLFTQFGYPAAYMVDGKLPDIATQFMRQLTAVTVGVVWSFGVTVVLVIGLEKTIGFRLTEEQEEMGMDLTQHGEVGYHMS
jgi:Amt family ammonium transporter